MNSPEIFTSLIGLGGVVFGSLLTYMMGVKDIKVKNKAEERSQYESIMNEQHRMYENLQEEVNRLQ